MDIREQFSYMPKGSWGNIKGEYVFDDRVTPEMKERFLADMERYEQEMAQVRLKEFEDTGIYKMSGYPY